MLGESVCVVARADSHVVGLPSQPVSLELAPSRKAYVHIARGSGTVNGAAVTAGDAVKLTPVAGMAPVSVLLESDGFVEALLFDLA